MRKWLCIICGLIYDEAQGWPSDGIAPGTAWKMYRMTGYVLTV